MKDYGELPGGKKELEKLLFPFYTTYPAKLWSKFRWWKKSSLKTKLKSLNKNQKWLTIIDRLGAPGDALITSIVIREIKQHYPRIKINCITPNPLLIRLDPHIDSINAKESFYSFDSTYWEFIVRKESEINIVEHSLRKLNIYKYEYNSYFYLSQDEHFWAQNKIAQLGFTKPIIAFCSKSKEIVKNWPENYWEELIEKLTKTFSIIHLGDQTEPNFSFVERFAGLCSMRESAALLSKAHLFVGPDSLLMHIANGFNIPSVIIFGGSRPINSLGYRENINLGSSPTCSPCWIHQGYESCKENLKCMHEISVNKVFSSINMLMKKSHE